MSADVEKRNLRGRVRSVLSRTAEFKKRGGKLEETPWLTQAESFDAEGRLSETIFDNAQHTDCYFRQTYAYDESCRLAEESFYFESGQLRGKTRYVYDSQNNLVQRLAFSGGGESTGKSDIVYDEGGRKLEESSLDASGKLITKTEFAYHVNGNRAEESRFDYGEYDFQGERGYSVDANPGYDHIFSVGSGQVRLEKKIYDLNGNISQLQFFDKEGRLLTRIVFTTDASGRITKDGQFGTSLSASDVPANTELPPEIAGLLSGESTLSESEIVYDAEGRKLEDRMTLAGAVFQRRVFKYDSLGELNEECTINADGTVQSRTQIEREYDGQGNWIVQLASAWNAEADAFEPSVVERREITYWD